MAIRTLVTRGFGNGTFNGTISLVVTRGYTIGSAVADVIVDTIAFVLHISRSENTDINITTGLNVDLHIKRQENIRLEG